MQLLTVLDVAKLLDRSSESVRAYEKTGKLRAVKTKSGIRLFQMDDVLEFKEKFQGSKPVKRQSDAK